MPYRWTLTNLSDLTTEVLSKDPIGWDDGTYSIKRSEIYKGAFHEYTTSLKFHCSGSGKEFIDNIYQTEDIDGRIDVLLEYDCDGSGTYDELFNGIINLASYQTDGNFTTVNIEKSDLLTKLFSRDEISVDLDSTTSIGGETITAVERSSLALTPVEVLYLGDWRVDNGYSWEDTEAFTSTGAKQGSFQPAMIMNYGDLNRSQQISEIGNFAENYNGYSVFHTGYEYMPFIELNELGISYPVTINWEIDFNGTITVTALSGSKTVRARLIMTYGTLTPSSPSVTQVTLYDSGVLSSNPETINFSIQDSGSFDMNAGNGVIIEWLFDFNVTSSPASIKVRFDYTSSFFKTNTNTSFNQTSTGSFLVHEAFNQVVDSIADSDGNFYSEYYGRTNSAKQTYSDDGCGSKIAITNGLNIREFDKPILASFKDMFDSFDCLHNIGMGVVNSKIRIEPLSYWFDNTTNIITLANVNSYELKNDNKRYYNKIEIGYQKWESEFQGGLQDPCSKREYSTKISSCKNALTKLCKFIASPFTIEFTRRKNKNVVSTEDWRYDNDNFILSVINNYTGTISFNSGTSIINLLSNLLPYPTIYDIQIGDTLQVSNTVSNNGIYTVANVFNDGHTIVVNEALTNETVFDTAILEGVTRGIFRAEKYGDSFSYGLGMDSLNTAYNLRFTPARMLQSHMNVITAGLQTINGDISFVKGDGNTDFECSANLIAYTTGCQEEYSGQQLKENQSFAWNDANVKNIAPIWGTETYSFEYPLSYTEFKAIKANPYGYVEFYKFANDIKYGFILSMEYKMKTGLTKFELLKANPVI